MEMESNGYDVKYRFDEHYHYRTEAPPPQPLWQDNILHFHTLDAQA